MRESSSTPEAVAAVSHAIGTLCHAVGHLVYKVLADGPYHHHHPRLAASLSLTLAPDCIARITLGKGHAIMFTVKDDHADAAYAVILGQVTDREGHPVPPTGLLVTVESDNPNAVAVLADPGGDQLKGSISFGGPNPDGTPSQANLTVAVKLADGTLVGSGGAQFTVTAGDPAAIASVAVAFADLQEDQPPVVAQRRR